MSLNKLSKIYVAGHSGLVGSAFMRRFRSLQYENIITRTHKQLDLTDIVRVREFILGERPEYVILAAAKVGGILANQKYGADLIYNNLMIQMSVIHASYLAGVKNLIFFGSNCAYPGVCTQPMKEECLLAGPLEVTSEPYAIAKIAGIKMCQAYNNQYNTHFLSVIPATLYGPHDNFDPLTSHVISALINKFDDAKNGRSDSVVVWGSGTPRREFLFVDDLVDACLHIMSLEDKTLIQALQPSGFLVNIGYGSDIDIASLAGIVSKIIGYDKGFVLDKSKPDGTKVKLLDSSIIHQLGWRPKVTLEEGIKKTYEWYKANRR